MSNIGNAIRTILANDATVGGLVSTRIYDRMPQKPTYPAISFEMSGQSSHNHMTGNAGLAECDIDVMCWGDRHQAALTLAEAVRLALSMYKGTSASIVIRRIFANADGDVDRIEPRNSSDLPTWFHERSYHVWYQEATS